MDSSQEKIHDLEALRVELISRIDGVIENNILSVNNSLGPREQDPFLNELKLLRADKVKSQQIVNEVKRLYVYYAETENDKDFWTQKLKDLDEKFLAGRCSTYSNIFLQFSTELGMEFKFSSADTSTIGEETEEMTDEEYDELFRKRTAGHRYLQILKIDGIDITSLDLIFDSTIGQFIRGYHNIFIGTRSELKKLIEECRSEGRIISTSYPELIFERAWGDSSQ